MDPDASGDSLSHRSRRDAGPQAARSEKAGEPGGRSHGRAGCPGSLRACMLRRADVATRPKGFDSMHRRRRILPRACLPTVVAALSILGGLSAFDAPVRAAEPKATAAAVACPTWNAYSTERALTVQGVPLRYKFGTSPYIGAGYNECARTVTVYFGGYPRATHYNIRFTRIDVEPPTMVKQIETGPATRGIRRVGVGGGTGIGGQLVLSVQACTRGGFLQSSSCTRFSPRIGWGTKQI